MTLFMLIFRIRDKTFQTIDNRYGLEKNIIMINETADAEIISITTID